jgi:glycerophosphoryl diester phosphodiesterase
MRVIGHRGTPIHPTRPENTLAAVRTALQAGVDGVEVDVRATEDGVLVLSHDGDLRRVLGTGAGTGPVIAATPLAELRSADLPGGTGVPTLTEVLDLAAVTGAHVVTEVKSLIVAPEGDPDRAVPRARAQGLTDVHLHLTHVRNDPAVVGRVRARGLLVGVGIVDDREEAEEMAALGVDLLCTDDPVGLGLARARRTSADTSVAAGGPGTLQPPPRCGPGGCGPGPPGPPERPGRRGRFRPARRGSHGAAPRAAVRSRTGASCAASVGSAARGRSPPGRGPCSRPPAASIRRPSAPGPRGR